MRPGSVEDLRDDEADLDAGPSMTASMSRVVNVLETWKLELAGRPPDFFGQGRRMHSAQKMLHYLRFGWFAGSTNQLHLVLQHAITAGMSPIMAQGVLKALEDKEVQPSSWSLKRYRLALDIAFLFLLQKEGIHAYIW